MEHRQPSAQEQATGELRCLWERDAAGGLQAHWARIPEAVPAETLEPSFAVRRAG